MRSKNSPSDPRNTSTELRPSATTSYAPSYFLGGFFIENIGVASSFSAGAASRGPNKADALVSSRRALVSSLTTCLVSGNQLNTSSSVKL